MPQKRWEYEALDSNGNLHSDIVIADDYHDVIEVCIKKGLYPRDIRELSKQAAANYGQLPKLKALKKQLETPRTSSEPKFASMSFKLKDDVEAPPQSRSPIDWGYLIFILLILALIAGSIAFQ